VGTPLDIYFKPVDRFVAGFVGTPPMNFINGRLISIDGSLYFDEGTAKLKIPADKTEVIKDIIDKQVVLGVRPESIVISDNTGADKTCLKAHVDVSEPLGENTDLYVSTSANKSLVARVQSRPGLTIGLDINLVVDMDKAHIFEQGALAKNRTVDTFKF
jgi:multiple sugar transport system ATP-binding protein